MRLFEIAPDFTRSRAGVLLTILQHLSSKVGKGAKIPLSSIVSLMNNIGYSFNYDDFKDLYDNVPAIKNLVGNFDQKEITLGVEPDIDTKREPNSDKTVDRMAKKATNKALKAS